MFSRIFPRNTGTITVVDENAGDNPVIPKLQRSSSETTEAQSSGSKRKGDPLESAGAAPPTKYQTGIWGKIEFMRLSSRTCLLCQPVNNYPWNGEGD